MRVPAPRRGDRRRRLHAPTRLSLRSSSPLGGPSRRLVQGSRSGTGGGGSGPFDAASLRGRGRGRHGRCAPREAPLASGHRDVDDDGFAGAERVGPGAAVDALHRRAGTSKRLPIDSSVSPAFAVTRHAAEALVVLQGREELVGPDGQDAHVALGDDDDVREIGVFGARTPGASFPPGGARSDRGRSSAEIVGRDVERAGDLLERVADEDAIEDALAIGVHEDVGRDDDARLGPDRASRQAAGAESAAGASTCGTRSTVPPRTASPGAIAFISTSFCVVVLCASATCSSVSPKRTT